MIPSSDGVFEVILNGAMVFSKKELDRHAEKGEVEKIIRERMQ